ncbi:MAG TPA: nucleotide pyrophosphatase/phosphodiesterase family protein [Candidatus Didemnitutus sp.]|jgi:predicted AlkP superfamily pyrophosphatase or phosphodiesterase
MNRVLLFPVLLLAAIIGPPSQPAADHPASRLVILVSIDGFRWDYFEKYHPAELGRLAADGVHARRMTSSFPSLTFPNHYTIVTGLRPEHHGIVANTFFDPDLNAKFYYTHHDCAVDPRWWSGGEPIWITAERQGLHSACFFWPGSDSENHGLRPSFTKPFDKHLTADDRVDGLLAWLALPEAQRPRVATLYFDMVDTAGHRFGPEAPETVQAIALVDTAIGRLLAGLQKIGLRDETDFVFVSDHGMEPVSPDRVVLLDDYVNPATIDVDFAGPVAGLRPKSETPAELLAHFGKEHPHVSVWLRSEVPEHLHYRASNRIAPVVLCADPGWYITTREYLRVHRPTFERGAHGFDPATPNMGALFVADGPSFRHNKELDDVDNVDIYNLLCATLKITPAANDGSQKLVEEVLAR